MAKRTKFGCLYSVVVCPKCSADLTESDALLIETVTNSGVRSETKDFLIGDGGDGVGVLADSDGLVEAGLHSETFCSSCHQSLADYEFGYEWRTDAEHNAAVTKAIAEAKAE